MQITRGIARILLHHLYCLFTLRLQWNKFTINKSLFTILVRSDQNGQGRWTELIRILANTALNFTFNYNIKVTSIAQAHMVFTEFTYLL